MDLNDHYCKFHFLSHFNLNDSKRTNSGVPFTTLLPQEGSGRTPLPSYPNIGESFVRICNCEVDNE